MSQYAVLVIAILAIFSTASTMTSSKIVNTAVNFIDEIKGSGENQLKTVEASRSGGEYEDPAKILSKLPGIARILGSIILQNGISDGSIPEDPLFLELLNINHYTLKELDNFNQSTANTFVDKLIAAKSLVSSKINVVNAETSLIDLCEVKTLWTGIEMSNLPKDLTGLSQIKSFDISPFKKFKTSDTVTLIQSGQKSDIKKVLKNLTNGIDKIPDISEILKSIKSISPLATFLSIMETINNQPLAKLNDFSTLKPDFDSNLKVLKDLATSDLHTALLLATRNSNYSTPGFPKGYEDIERVPKDLKDPWILSALNFSSEHNLTESVSKLRAPLEKFEASLRGIKPSRKMSLIALRLAKTSDFSTESISSIVEDLQKCSITVNPSPKSIVRGIVENVNLLNIKLSALQSIKEAITPEVRRDFENLDDLKKVEDLLSSLELHLDVFHDDCDFSVVVNSIETDQKYVTEFETTLLQDVKFLNCIKEVKVEEIQDSLELMRDVRNQPPELGENLKAISASVSNAIEGIPDIRKVFKSIANKKDSNPELKNLTNYSNEIRTIGIVLHTVNSEASIFENYLTSLKSLEKSIYSLPLDSDLIEFMRSMTEFHKVSKQISKFLGSTSTWKSSIKVEKNSKLDEYGGIFKDLTEIPDVDSNMAIGIQAIEKFEESSAGGTLKVELWQLKESMRKMEGLELRFSKFKKELENMPTVFEEIMEVLRGAQIDRNEDSGQGVFWIAFICVIAVFIVIILIWCWIDHRLPIYIGRHWIRAKLQNNKNMKTAREGKPPVEGFPKSKTDKRDERKDTAKKEDTLSAEKLPPPPREPDSGPGAASTGASEPAKTQTTDNNNARGSNGSGSAGSTAPVMSNTQRPSKSMDTPELPSPVPPRTPPKTKASGERMIASGASGSASAAQPTSPMASKAPKRSPPLMKPSSEAKPSGGTDPLNSGDAVSKGKQLVVQQVDETHKSPTPPAKKADRASPALKKKQKKKQSTKTASVEKTKTKTRDDSTEEELPPPPPPPMAQKPKQKKKDTLDADTSDSSTNLVKTTSETKTSRFTQDNRPTLDEIDNGIFDSKMESKNSATSDAPPPPLPHKKQRSKDTKKLKNGKK